MKTLNERIPVIDFIGVMSALWLVIYHYVCAFDTISFGNYLKPIANRGFFGAEFFNILRILYTLNHCCSRNFLGCIPSLFIICLCLFSNKTFSISSYLIRFAISVQFWHALVCAEVEIDRRLLNRQWNYSAPLTFVIVICITMIQSAFCYYFIEKN